MQAKRGVLAVLRVQPAANLVESLVEPVTYAHEALWEEIVNTELVYNEMQEQRHGRQPSAGINDSAYRLQDIRTCVAFYRTLASYLLISTLSTDSLIRT